MTRRSLPSMTIAAMAMVLSCGSFGSASSGTDTPTDGGGDASATDASATDASVTDAGATEGDASDPMIIYRADFETSTCAEFTEQYATGAGVPGRTGQGCKVCRDGTGPYFNVHKTQALPKAAGMYNVEAWVRLDGGAFTGTEVGFLVNGGIESKAVGVITSAAFTKVSFDWTATSADALAPGIFVFLALPAGTPGTFCFVVDDLVVRKL